MSHQQFSSISVSDITAAADVSRICFYRNFSTKEEILERLIGNAVRDIQSQPGLNVGISGMYEYYLTLFKGISNYSVEFCEIYKANLGSLMLDQFNDKLFETPLQNSGNDGWAYRRRFYTGAFYNVLVEWIINGMKESPESMAMTCSSLIRL